MNSLVKFCKEINLKLITVSLLAGFCLHCIAAFTRGAKKDNHCCSTQWAEERESDEVLPSDRFQSRKEMDLCKLPAGIKQSHMFASHKDVYHLQIYSNLQV